MSTTQPDANTNPKPDDAAQSVERLTKSLEAERADHAKLRERFRVVRESLGLKPDADDKAIMGALKSRDDIVAEKTAALLAERDGAVKRASELESRWNAERLDRALGEALKASGMVPANHEDAANLMRPLFDVQPDGRVLTKAAPNVVPGQTPEQFVLSQLRSMRGHWWAPSQGGGARGSASTLGSAAGDASCFDPKSPTYSVTRQAQFEARFGTDAARRAARRFGQSLAGEVRR
ncbi:hypothetical protein J4558_09440 [Leptolyngbya sp. 15MV]|nr:hypothetical protein J4558_09440 [Leptolyngbya sp. 15MV]